MVAVSIALPVYNGERHLGETIESLLAQDFGDFELLVSDNASTDATPEIVRSFAAQDPRVRFERHEVNRGAIWNYNHLVADAAGRYLKWSGHDDLCAPSYLRRCVAELDTTDAVLAYPRTVLIDVDGAVKRPYDDGLDLRQPAPHARVRACLHNLGLANAVFGLIRLDVLRCTPLFGAYNDSDLVLLLELALAGEIHEIDEPLFYRRMHAGQAYQANTTPLAVRRWFDPSHAPRFVLPRTRRFVEAARAIGRAPIGTGERLRCVGALVQVWGPSHLYHGVREIGRATTDFIGGRVA
jgi:glycosyltransferase involved in cell wall biosynthesis